MRSKHKVRQVRRIQSLLSSVNFFQQCIHRCRISSVNTLFTLEHWCICQAVMQGTSPTHCAMVIPQRSLGTSWIRRLQKGVDRMNEHGSISDPCHSWSNQHDNENSTLKRWWRNFPSSRCPICLAGFHLVSREVSGTSSLPADVQNSGSLGNAYVCRSSSCEKIGA